MNQLAILCKAGHILSTDEVAKAWKYTDMLVTQYNNVIESIDRELFITSALHDDMKLRMKGELIVGKVGQGASWD